MAWYRKSEVLQFDSLSGLDRVTLFLHTVNDHHGDRYNWGRINQIKLYASKLGENFLMYDVSLVAILEKKAN